MESLVVTLQYKLSFFLAAYKPQEMISSAGYQRDIYICITNNFIIIIIIIIILEKQK